MTSTCSTATARSGAFYRLDERILLFCLASDTVWQAASITHATTQQMMMRGLIERQAASTAAARQRAGSR